MTQVVAVRETHVFHNRLTHTLKVAQIAERTAQRLLRKSPADQVAAIGGVDANVAKAAALAHDLGHPPFGHVAEAALSRKCSSHHLDGYEGNAQSFRIVNKLAYRNSDEPGLNLTAATLNGILKYPWLREGDRESATKWGAYPSERIDFDRARQGMPTGRRSIEAEIMDWADDIAYAVHDVEDFYRVGLIPLDRLPQGGREARTFISKAVAQLKAEDPSYVGEAGDDAFEDVMKLVPLERPYRGTREDRRSLHRLATLLITRYVGAAKIGDEHTPLVVPASVRDEVKMLKQLTWQYVIHNPSLATLQEGQVKLIEGLFDALMDWVSEEEKDYRLPAQLREGLMAIKQDQESQTALQHDEEALHARAVADYIALLTEDQAYDLYERLHGLSRHSILESWVRS